MASELLIQAVAVTSELCGRTFSPEAAAVFLSDLDGFEEAHVLGALKRCRREVRGMLTVQDVVSRLDDGRPGPDEAWAMVPRDEHSSVVWNDEISRAYAVASPIMQHDRIAARLAFREAYVNAVNEAREQRKRVTWWPSLGHSKEGREQAIVEAVDRGRLTSAQAQQYLPAPDQPKVAGLLSGPSSGMPADVRGVLAQLRIGLAKRGGLGK